MPTKSNSVDVSADVKVPRGSKLDAVKRAEFQSDVGHVDDWDTSTWSSWTVTVVRGHVAALCALEKSSASVFEIADVVRSALAFPVDYIAFQNLRRLQYCIGPLHQQPNRPSRGYPNF